MISETGQMRSRCGKLYTGNEQAEVEHLRLFSVFNRRVCGNCYSKKYDGYVFVDAMGNIFNPRSVTANFSKLLEQNGLRHIRFHDLRHSCASLLLANDVPLKQIQEWLGHSDIGTTANIYSHLDYKSKITSAQAMETGLALPEGGEFSSRWSSISAGENS